MLSSVAFRARSAKIFKRSGFGMRGGSAERETLSVSGAYVMELLNQDLLQNENLTTEDRKLRAHSARYLHLEAQARFELARVNFIDGWLRQCLLS